MNPTTATINECRDYIAKRKGWTLGTDPKWIGTSGFIVWQRDGVQHPSLGHPIPATLDAAHDSLPEGWEWDSIVRCVSDYATHKYFSADVLDAKRDIYAEADAEGHTKESMLLAMFRASAAAWAQVIKEPADGQ